MSCPLVLLQQSCCGWDSRAPRKWLLLILLNIFVSDAGRCHIINLWPKSIPDARCHLRKGVAYLVALIQHVGRRVRSEVRRGRVIQVVGYLRTTSGIESSHSLLSQALLFLSALAAFLLVLMDLVLEILDLQLLTSAPLLKLGDELFVVKLLEVNGTYNLIKQICWLHDIFLNGSELLLVANVKEVLAGFVAGQALVLNRVGLYNITQSEF